MNILLIALADIWSLQESGIYQDLMRTFVTNGNFIAVISPTAAKELVHPKAILEENAIIVKLQSGSIQKTNVFSKTLNTIALDARIKRAIATELSRLKFDIVLYSTPPITITQAVRYVQNRDKARTYLLLKDIFPQNAVDLGMIRTRGIQGLVHKYFRMREKELYGLSDYIGCMSPANVTYLLANYPSISPDRVEVCPNSIEPSVHKLSETERAHNRAKCDLPQDRAIFVYGGNIGLPQGVEFIIKCLQANEAQPRAFFLIVGAGTEFSRLQAYFNSATPKHARLIAQLQKIEYEALCASCDVGLIFLDHRFTVPNFPSRLLSYMDAAMPVLAATDRSTDLGPIIEEGKFGLWCESTTVEGFMHQVEMLCDPALRKQMGQAAKQYLVKHYTAQHSYNVIMNHFAGGKLCSTTKPC